MMTVGCGTASTYMREGTQNRLAQSSYACSLSGIKPRGVGCYRVRGLLGFSVARWSVGELANGLPMEAGPVTTYPVWFKTYFIT
jgi:hypothetical protein